MVINSTVSVIVPCYNSESTLLRCLESLRNQTRPFYEIIIINDGSMDRTEDIANSFLSNNKNVSVYTISNSGVATARNLGISKANGNYITFVDSDDLVESTFCEKLLFPFEKYTNCDLSICSVVGGYGFLKRKEKYIELNQAQVFKRVMNDIDVQGYLCNKMFRTEIIKKNNLVLDQSLPICEDLDFTLRYIQYVKSASLCTSREYHYLDNVTSATRANFNKQSLNLLSKLEEISAYPINVRNYPQRIEAKLTTIALWLFLKYHRSAMTVHDRQIEKLIMSWLKDRKRNYFKYWYTVNPRKYFVLYIILMLHPQLFKNISLKTR